MDASVAQTVFQSCYPGSPPLVAASYTVIARILREIIANAEGAWTPESLRCAQEICLEAERGTPNSGAGAELAYLLYNAGVPGGYAHEVVGCALNVIMDRVPVLSGWTELFGTFNVWCARSCRDRKHFFKVLYDEVS